ncbi:MAG: hypothetical protein O3C51_16305 [Planctomycetota bacterium]|nr:hypothetical protein [Planctomycetota bacterium]MDA1222520.1 hypothetical protein [Planctomycetota bacterium]
MTRILPMTAFALAFGILTPLVYALVADGLPPGGTTGVIVLAVLGAALGAFLGWRFPGAFYFLFEALLSS